MDAVNEAVTDNCTDRKKSELYDSFGDNSYVFEAFKFVRKYSLIYDEAQMKLYYNDYNTYKPHKADCIIKLCEPIYEAGYLDGIDMQEHNSIHHPTRAEWIATYDKFNSVCSEMSVNEPDVNPGTPPNYRKQAAQYKMLFNCFFERSYRSGRGKIVNVSKNGLNDK